MSSTFKVNWLTYVNEATALTQVKLYTNETDAAVNQLIPSGYEDVDGVDVGSTTIEIPAYYGLLVLKTSD